MTSILLTLPQGRLRNAEFLQYHAQQGQTIQNNTDAYEKIKTTADKYMQVYAELNAVFVQDAASAFTAQIEQADHERDAYLTGLKLACEAKTYHPAAAVRTAAQTLLHHIRIYGKDIQIQNLNAETAIIQNLIRDLKTKPELTQCLEATGTGEWIVPLQDANNKVEDLYQQRTNEQAAQNTNLPYTMKQKRKEMMAVWEDLSGKIAGHFAIQDGASPWKELVGNLNALTKKYADLLANRPKETDKESPLS